MIPEIAFAFCSWAIPGALPYTGTVEDALARLPIPIESRVALVGKIQAGTYDELVHIHRDAVFGATGRWRYSNLMLMHFDERSLCYGVDRSKWAMNHHETAPVYCADQYCIAIPLVCGNVTQVFRYRRNAQDAAERTRYAVPSDAEIEHHHQVPTPGTAELLGVGLAALLVSRKYLSINA